MFFSVYLRINTLIIKAITVFQTFKSNPNKKTTLETTNVIEKKLSKNKEELKNIFFDIFQ